MFVISFVEKGLDFFNLTNVYYTEDLESASEITNSLNLSLRFLQTQWQKQPKLGCISIQEWGIFIVSPEHNLKFEFKQVKKIEYSNIINIPATTNIHLFSKEQDEFINPLVVEHPIR